MKIFLLKKKICFVTLFLFTILASSAFAERLSVSVNSAIVRFGPDIKEEIVWEHLDKNYPLLVLDKKKSWYFVRDYENDVGWIHKSCVDKTDSVITKKDECQIRSEPGITNPVVFVVNNGVPFKVLKRKGNWLKIQHSDGDKGWIHKKLVW